MDYIVFILILFMQYVTKSYGYYFWTDYQKRIPNNAYSGGIDSNHDQVYIGQAFIYENTVQGIYPTTIYIDKDVYAPRYGARKADNFVQILCSTDPENFEWISTNSTYFHLMKSDNEIVRGGIEFPDWVSIGRIKVDGGTVIGKVMSGAVGEAEMWFVHNGNEKKAVIFEVLTYKGGVQGARKS